MGFSSRTARMSSRSLRNTLGEAQARPGTQISVEYLALGLLAVSEGLVPPILSALGVPGTGIALRDPRPLPAGGLKGTSGMSHLFRNYSGKDAHEG